MSVSRPAFTNGAILSATDLAGMVDLDRDSDGRHARHLHTPGVAAGLAISSEERTTAGGDSYLELTLEPGYAIDGNGREIVVGESLALTVDRFVGDNPNPPTEGGGDVTAWHPVFIIGFDQETAGGDGGLLAGCQVSGATKTILEQVEIEFGSPGDALVDQPVVDVDAGPGSGGWRVLVGFVKFNTAFDRFVEVGTEDSGTRVPSAGARAGLIAGRDGRVEIRSLPDAEAATPAVVVDSDDGGSLLFGTHNGSGVIDQLMKVDSSGNLEVKGTVTSKQVAGSVLIASGLASDGTVLPLPAGVDQSSVDSGAVELAIFVTPRFTEPVPGGPERFMPAVCRVDSDRRVHCWGTLFNTATPASSGDVSATADYLIVVTVP